MKDLNKPVESFQYIGPVYLKRLRKLGIETLRDLLFHFPTRYEDLTNLKKIKETKIGEEVTIQGKITEIRNKKTPKKRMFITEALIEDDTGIIRSIWFNQPFLTQNLKKEDHISLAGKLKVAPEKKESLFKNNKVSEEGAFLSNPAYEKISSSDLAPPKRYAKASKNKKEELIHTHGLIPIYPETEGISSKWLRFIIYPLLKEYSPKVKEFLPKEVLERNDLPGISKALFRIHFPNSEEEAEEAKKRFAFQELLLIQLYLQSQKKKLQKQKAPKISPEPEIIENFKQNLPFEFTQDQKAVFKEIFSDLQKETPMSRLLEGEVGSGKTVVATLSAFVAAKNKYQVALMAPTEILAEQHFKEITSLIPEKEGISIGLLTNEKCIIKEKASTKISPDNFAEKVSTHGIDIAIGTHSLIQEKIKFKKLGLVIVDEQHRFGIEQRVQLTQKNSPDPEKSSETKASKNKAIPHFLSMTATPIPRSLALALYGDLSISKIEELPQGRKEIVTKIVPPAQREETYQFLKEEIKKGRQGFIVCPLIEESEKLEVKSAKEEFERLREEVFLDSKLELLHSKVKPKEKERIMQEFKEKNIDVLVSTPVVEVGIDVANASFIVIEGADRFGLSQLYQLRGRVGRGKHQSYCFLFTEATGKKTWQRLNAIASSKNAFELSEKDLKIRGPGDFIGKRQSGIPDLTMASLTDISLIKKTKQEAEKLLGKDPYLKQHKRLKDKLEEFRKSIIAH